MLEFERIAETNILELTLDGKLTYAELEQVKAELERMIEAHPKVRILEVIRNVGAMEPRAVWEDLKFVPKHIRNFSHVAVVADQKWVEWITVALRAFIPAEVRFYHLSELEQARHWIREAPEQDEPEPPQPTAPAAPPGN